MKKFEQGKTYYTHSICNYDCIFAYTIKKRTAKTAVLVDRTGNEKRRKINEANGIEYITVESYSMAPVIHADREYIA